MHTFLTMSLTAAIAAGVVMLLRLLLKRVPRWVTCLLWAVVLLRMVCRWLFPPREPDAGDGFQRRLR